MFTDLRIAFRTLLRERAFAIVAVATLALGIGGNTAIFSLVNGILLKPLPFHDPERLFALREVVPAVADKQPTVPVSANHFLTWREQSRSIEQISAISMTRYTFTGQGEAEELSAAEVSASFLPMLGITPQMGRNFSIEEDSPGHDRVVLISDSLWRRRFNAHPQIIGSPIRLQGRAFTIIGVLPVDFRFPAHEFLGDYQKIGSRIEVLKPIAFRASGHPPMGEFNFGALARLRKGVTAEQALSELNVIQANIVRANNIDTELRAWLAPLQMQLASGARSALLVLMAAVGVVLLIVCVNLANVLLARATARSRDAAVRAALGASAARLVRHTLAEAALLSFLGGVIGVAAAWAGVRFVVTAAPLDVPRLHEVTIDGSVLLFVFAVSSLTALLFGILPAWRMSRAQPADALRSSGRGLTQVRQGARLRGALVALEVGLSTVLLIAAGLLLKSFANLMNTEKGFQVERVLAVDFSIAPDRYGNPEKRAVFHDRLVERVRAIPGVVSAATASKLPLQGISNINVLTLPGDTRPMFERPMATFLLVTPDYFATLGIPLRRGRTFEERDHAGEKRTVILSESAAAHLWPNEDPIGKLLHDGDTNAPTMGVVGVVGDMRVSSLDMEPGFTMYYPHWALRARLRNSLLVRTAADPVAAAGAVRAAFRDLDPEVAVAGIRTMDEVVNASVAQRRFQLALIGAFAAAALLLAAIGIYGVVSYSVARRRNEIGIRMALGARASDVQWMVLRQGMLPVAAGLLGGIAGALALGRLLESMLHQVKPADPATIAGVAALLGLIALAACWIPASRATRSDPLNALRYE